ncbi:MAG TPA: response regulator [Terriglobales bacterium]|nr:response regulator [Terriglobales bacterium]
MGCTDTFELAAIAESGTTLAGAEPPEGRPTILLVEDEDFVREVTCQVLQSAGYHVLQAREAIAASVAFRCHRQEVRLLVTDVVMPGQNGRDLARELRSVCPGLKTLFVSGYPENVITRAENQGRTEFYLPKPFSAQSLVRTVRSILEPGETSEEPLAMRAAGTG